MRNQITSFRGYYRFLSNFFVEPDGSHVEGEYQVAKCADPGERVLFNFQSMTPGQAKRIGQKVRMRSDWDKAKLHVMYDLVSAKFHDHPELARKLLATGDTELVEGNNWGDTYWGMVNGVGENNLGKILMRVRAELRAETEND